MRNAFTLSYVCGGRRGLIRPQIDYYAFFRGTQISCQGFVKLEIVVGRNVGVRIRKSYTYPGVIEVIPKICAYLSIVS